MGARKRVETFVSTHCVSVQILPVRPCSLRGQLHPVHGVVAVVVHDLGQAEVCDLYLPTGSAVYKQDIT